MLPMPDVASRRAAFRDLHETGCFVVPNPWDIGTARTLKHLGFSALATTSAGYAFSRGLPDTDWAVSRDAMLAHIAEIVDATDLPVTADFESGYAHAPEDVAANVRLCLATGVAGLSIEDATGDEAAPLYDIALAADRVRAAREAVDADGGGALLTARAECYLTGHPDPLPEALRRIAAYARAGADALYVPGVRTRGEIAAVIDAAGGTPVNVLMSAHTGLTVADLASLGVRRVSLGSALARAAWGAFERASRAIAERGGFEGLEGATPFAEINGFFRDDLARRKTLARRTGR